MQGKALAHRFEDCSVLQFALSEGRFHHLVVRAFYDLPATRTSHQGELMVDDDIQYLAYAALLQRVGAYGQHPMITNYFVDSPLILLKVLPISILQPIGVASQS